jgi:hypothetical protein
MLHAVRVLGFIHGEIRTGTPGDPIKSFAETVLLASTEHDAIRARDMVDASLSPGGTCEASLKMQRWVQRST